MFFQSKQSIANYQRQLLPGSLTTCRLHDTIDVDVRILSIAHRHHTSGVRVTLYITEQIGASNVILAALSPLKEEEERLVAMMVIPFQWIDQERRPAYRGDGVFLGNMSRAIQTLICHLESGCYDDELDELRQTELHPTLESMCCAVGACNCLTSSPEILRGFPKMRCSAS